MQGKNPTAVISELVPLVAPLGDAFTGTGFETALVDGPAQDALLGQAPHNLDLTTSARPEEIETVLRPQADAMWDVGRNFGTIGARKGGAVFETTTYRYDEYQRSSRRPLVRFGDTLEGDLWRRDFTVNAMALRLPEITLVDPTGGGRDLEQQMLRTPISPEGFSSDNPLWVVRAARFAAQLGFDINYNVLIAMQDMRERLQIVLRERVQAEFSRLLVSPWPRRELELVIYTDAATQIVPKLMNLRGMQDEHKHHKDMQEHSLIVLEQAIAQETGPDDPVPEPGLVLCLAVLLHDIGKPATRRLKDGEVMTFHQHDVVGTKITRRWLRELKYDKATVRDVSRLITLHQRLHGYGEQPWADSTVRRYVIDAGPLSQRLHRLTRADCTTHNARKTERLSATYDDLEVQIAALQTKEELDVTRPELDGSEIMEILGISPGPQVGKAYKYLSMYRMENGLVGRETAETVLREWREKYHNGRATRRESS